MKKYRLIKKYPGSPKLGSILTLYINGVDYGVNLSNLRVFRHKNEIENHPEFWEEVVEYPIGTKVHNSQTNTIYTKKKDGWYKPAEKTAYTDEMIGSYKHLTLLGKSEEVIEKDYEILSFSYEDKVFTTLRDNGKYFSTSSPNKFDPNGYFCGHTKEQELNFGGKVHSIKRLSDGEIFTVGDEVTSLGLRTYKISKIDFSTHPVHKDVIGLYFDNYQHILLKVAEHVKKPLFTTEDGVDIFEGDKYYTVYTMKDGKGIYKTWETQNHPFAASGKSKDFVHEDVVYFSTKEAAEQYIFWNKSNLSLKDVFDVYPLTKKQSGTLTKHAMELIGKVKKI